MQLACGMIRSPKGGGFRCPNGRVSEGTISRFGVLLEEGGSVGCFVVKLGAWDAFE